MTLTNLCTSAADLIILMINMKVIHVIYVHYSKILLYHFMLGKDCTKDPTVTSNVKSRAPVQSSFKKQFFLGVAGHQSHQNNKQKECVIIL